MKQTNSNGFTTCEYCERLIYNDNLSEVEIEENFESSTSFNDFMCNKCIENNEQNEDGQYQDTRTAYKTEFTALLRAHVEYNHSVSNALKYLFSKDKALTNYITNQTSKNFHKKLNLKKKNKHNQSILSAVGWALLM